MTGPQKFAVFCHDAATGKQLWKRELDTGRLPRITPPNSHASSTPAQLPRPDGWGPYLLVAGALDHADSLSS